MRHKKSPPNRSYRIADQIRRDLAELIRDLKDPRLGMVTISQVEVTPDYAHAKVFFTVLVGDAEASGEALNEAAGFLRNGLFKRLLIHTVPTLHFQFDRTTERAAELSALIARANASRAAEDAPASPDEPPPAAAAAPKA
jgi:ribosome-binding factor A